MLKRCRCALENSEKEYIDGHTIIENCWLNFACHPFPIVCVRILNQSGHSLVGNPIMHGGGGLHKHPFGFIYWYVSGIVERPHPFFNPVADPSSHQTSIFDSHQLASFEFPRGWHHGMSMLSRNAGKSPKWSTYIHIYLLSRNVKSFDGNKLKFWA